MDKFLTIVGSATAAAVAVTIIGTISVVTAPAVAVGVYVTAVTTVPAVVNSISEISIATTLTADDSVAFVVTGRVQTTALTSPSSRPAASGLCPSQPHMKCLIILPTPPVLAPSAS